MKFEFKNKNLIELYTEGKSKKYKFLNKVEINKFMIAVGIIESAANINDFRKMSSLNFEHLNGNRYSMRLSRQNRLEMLIEWEDENKTLGTIYLDDITKHYE